MIRSITRIFLIVFLLSGTKARAEEGMWIPLLLKELNESSMQALGLRLSADDIYAVNKSSLKDAIVHFGGYCTGEMISDEGLMFTNHHCGLRTIQSHSSVENDLITRGFWAGNRKEELVNPGLFARFLVRIEDVTDQVLEGINSKITEETRESVVKQRIKELETKATQNTHYEAQVKPFFYGNEYYLFITETFHDVRLVGAPPSSIGKFGGDTDNWMWPRHSGDFAIYRIYTDKDGKPAPFAENNIPFKPRHHFPISLKGIAQGDFTMVFGYPGSTEQYLHARALEDLLENVDPHRIALRKVRLEILDMAMQENSEIKIQYTSKYARIANYYKKWIGESWGLTKFGALQSKYGEEAQFAKWASKGKRKKEYGSLMQDFHAIYDQREGLTQVQNYRMEAILGIEIMQLANQLTKLEAIPESGPQRDRVLQALKNYSEKFFKDYHAPTDKKVFEALLTAYQKNIHEDFQTTEIRTPAKEFTELFDASILTNEAEILKIVEDPSGENLSILLNDEVYSMYKEFELMYEHSVAPGIKETNLELEKLYRKYVTGLREMHKRKSFYPDANSTLRISYGIVDGYQPLDAVSYRYYTTIDGIMEKYVADDKDFDLPEKIIELYDTKEYGRYMTSDGDLPVCFIASNHTTGGNSGSPVLNADGHLIGINFDRSWESTMSDYHYDPAICRNIAVDTRYILFIIDKYAGAGYLLEEMTIIK